MSLLLLILLSLLSAVFFFFVLGFRRKTGSVTGLPNGSLGWFPIIGETLSFLRAQEKNESHKWLDERVAKHGHVFKTHLMGSPTVVLVGQAANKFLFTAPEDVLASKQPVSINAIAGKNNIFELTGSRYKMVKGAMMSFLKPETLTTYTGQMDRIVKRLIAEEVAKQSDGRHTVKAVVLMKKLTFHLACDILFGIHDEPTKQALFDDFTIAFKALWSLPLNFPGTTFWKGLRARSRIDARVRPIVRKRREEVESGRRGPTSDVVSCLMCLREEEEGGEAIEEEVIMDNFVTLMIASHDTSAILASLMIWKFSQDQHIHNKVLQEQMEIKKIMIERSKQGDGGPESLTWADIQKMKYTWRVAQELMRVVPPVFGSFRNAVRDITYGDHCIPKGWQVLWAASGTHLNKDIFKNPNEFDPMRFEKPYPPYTYVAFGGGVRTCIGNEFARVETLIIIHNMVTTYEWSQLNPDEVITRQPMPYPSLGLPIKIKPMVFM